jgi:hypothetical protein
MKQQNVHHPVKVSAHVSFLYEGKKGIHLVDGIEIFPLEVLGKLNG